MGSCQTEEAFFNSRTKSARNALLSTPRAIPGSRGALIFRLETCGHAVWPEILSPDDVLYCVKYEAYYESGCISANPPCEWSYWVDYDPDISAALQRLREDVFARGDYATEDSPIAVEL